MTSKQKIAIGLVGAAAAALLFCALSKQWFQIKTRGSTTSVGLLSIETCIDRGDSTECETESLSDFFAPVLEADDSVSTWLSASKFTFVLALASVVLLLGVGVLGFLRHDKVATVGKLTLLVLILTILGSVVVLAKRPPINASLGVFLFMVSGMAGVIGAQMLTNPQTYVEEVRDPSIPRL